MLHFELFLSAGCADSSVNSTLLVAEAAAPGKTSSGGRGETPPPTYAEAVIISQAANTPMPLYIALPDLNHADAIATAEPTSRTDTGHTSESQRLVNV